MVELACGGRLTEVGVGTSADHERAEHRFGIKQGQVAVNTSKTAKFTCRLAKGKYKYLVYATDVAGNAQARIGSARLTVR